MLPVHLSVIFFFTSQMKGALFPEGLYPHIKARTGDKHMKLI